MLIVNKIFLQKNVILNMQVQNNIFLQYRGVFSRFILSEAGQIGTIAPFTLLPIYGIF